MEEIREDVVRASFGQNESLSVGSELSIPSIETPPLVQSYVPRTETVKAIQAKIDETDWFALHGSLGSGKTQLAALLAAQTKSLVYVSLRDLNALEANFLLHHFFTQLCSGKRQGSVTAAGLASLGPGATVVLDDLPRFHKGERLAERLVQIARQVAQRAQKLVTLSHYPIPVCLRDRLIGATFSEYVAPKFTRSDTGDLLRRLGLADKEENDEIIDSLLIRSDGNGLSDAGESIERSLLATFRLLVSH